MASVFLCLKFTSLNKGKNWSVKSVVSLTQDFQLFLTNFNRGKMNSIYLFINILVQEILIEGLLYGRAGHRHGSSLDSRLPDSLARSEADSLS